MKRLQTRNLYHVCVLALAALFTVSATLSALAADAITARYIEPRGNDIHWKIVVPSPAPAAVIVTQYIRPGSSIVKTSHPVSSYDQNNGVAKWLLTGIKPGTLKMSMEIDLPIRKKGEIRGEIMFQDRDANPIASVLMTPKAQKKAVEGC